MSSIINNVMNPLVTSLVRHALTAGGGGLIVQGTSQGSDTQTAAGAIVTLLGLIWSYLKNKK
jgi:hypothetical protein